MSAALVRRIHRDKTAKLLAVALTSGALLAGCRPAGLKQLEKAGLDLGLAFQGADDILDVTATTGQLGKSAGKDEAAGKATWIRVDGLDAARRRTARLGQAGLQGMGEILPPGPSRERLLDLAAMMWQREK